MKKKYNSMMSPKDKQQMYLLMLSPERKARFDGAIAKIGYKLGDIIAVQRYRFRDTAREYLFTFLDGRHLSLFFGDDLGISILRSRRETELGIEMPKYSQRTGNQNISNWQNRFNDLQKRTTQIWNALLAEKLV